MDEQILTRVPVNFLAVLDENGKWIGNNSWVSDFSQASLYEDTGNRVKILRKKIERKIKFGDPIYRKGISPQVVRIKSVEVEIVDPRFSFTEWLEILEAIRNE